MEANENDIQNLWDDFNTLIEKYLDKIPHPNICSILICRLAKMTYSIAPSHKEAVELLKESINEGIKLFLKEEEEE